MKTLRKSDEVFRPEGHVTYQKQRRLIAPRAEIYGEAPGPKAYYRFDVVSVVLPEDGKPEIMLFRKAFLT